ncbi:MAG: helix-turn-helix domain-containing protein [Muricoprocola sp.]
MMNENFDILKKNIKYLMDSHKPQPLTQAELGSIIGISQPNISKYISPQYKGPGFALEHVLRIADYFNVSIDFLLGREIKDNTHVTNIGDCCANIVKMFEGNFNAKFELIDISEQDMTTWDEYPNPIDRKYYAIYFSEQKRESADQIDLNSYNAYSINKFIKRFINIRSMKQRGDLDEEDYNTLLEKYIKDSQNETLSGILDEKPFEKD